MPVRYSATARATESGVCEPPGPSRYTTGEPPSRRPRAQNRDRISARSSPGCLPRSRGVRPPTPGRSESMPQKWPVTAVPPSVAEGDTERPTEGIRGRGQSCRQPVQRLVAQTQPTAQPTRRMPRILSRRHPVDDRFACFDQFQIRVSQRAISLSCRARLRDCFRERECRQVRFQQDEVAPAPIPASTSRTRDSKR